MPPRVRFSLSWQILLAIVLGMFGALAIRLFEPSFGVIALKSICRGSADVFLLGANLLALPMVVASAVEGLVGLEATRGLQRLGWKTLVCFAGACLAVLLLGVLLGPVYGLLRGESAVRWYQPSVQLELRLEEVPRMASPAIHQPAEVFSAPFWLGVTFLGLGCGLYRNRIGEGRAHLLLRFWRGADEIFLLLTGWLRRVVPFGLFALVFSAFCGIEPPAGNVGGLAAMIGCVVAGWIVYAGGVLPLALWLLTRTNPWRYALLWWPAVATAFASGKATVALPLALEGERRRTGISSRVACVTLPLGAVLLRDGILLGWSMAGIPSGGLGISHHMLPLALPPLTLEATYGTDFFLLNLIVVLGGSAVSQWSAACLSAIIAYWEGERDLLTPRPPEDPLFGERLSKDFV